MIRPLVLGIDTGGTHTDAAVCDLASKALLASAKAGTTHDDLSWGISEALLKISEKKWPGGFKAIDRVNLSTTLATNSVAEGHGAPVGLIMIGYDGKHESVLSQTSRLPLASTRFICGGHDFYGRPAAELDEDAVKAAVMELEGQVSGWAVSAMFSIKNPDHELKTAEIIRRYSDRPVTMGRDLTGRYDAVRRAATAALNAGLVPTINRLLDAVKRSMAELGLKARLMVVKGDGSLVSEDWARERPIETVVSGPAASALGANILGRALMRQNEENLWVADIGGTTTDLIFMKKGRPTISPDGAGIGRWKTMTTAVQTQTRGLGGDSQVSFNHTDASISIGPRRILPLCRLAEKWPQALDTLKAQKMIGTSASQAVVFFLPGVQAPEKPTQAESMVLRAMADGYPLPLSRYLQRLKKEKLHFPGLSVLQHPGILISAFTPTDAMAALGLYNEGSPDASLLGAELIGRGLNLSAEKVAGLVMEEFSRLLAQEIVSYSLQGQIKCEAGDFSADGLFASALQRRSLDGLEIVFRSPDTIFLLGGPAAAVAPFLARYLEGRIIVPPAFDTANAVGAAAAPIALSRRVEIHQMSGRQGYRLFLPDEIVEGWSVEILTEIAQRKMTEHMRALAAWAGAPDTEIKMEAVDRKFILKNGRTLHMGASLTFTAEQK